MTLIKKNGPDFHFSPLLEFLIVAISLVLILVPIRIFTKIVFADNWIGSIGIISVVFGLILYLSKNNRLGIFGQMFIRQIIRNHKGKRKWAIYLQISLFLFVGLLTIFSIHAGNTEFHSLKKQIIEEFNNRGVFIDSTLNFDSINYVSSQVSPEQQLGAIATLPLLIIQNFQLFSVVLSVTDQMMGGWVMYFWQIMVIETIEIAIFLSVSKKFILKNHKSQ